MSTSKILTNLFVTKQKTKSANYFCKYCLQCFISEIFLLEHKQICLKITAKQTVKLKNGFIEFKNYFRQLPTPFKIYCRFWMHFKNC